MGCKVSRYEAWVTLGRRIGTWGCSDGRVKMAKRLKLPGRTAGGRPSVVELVGQRLVEYDGWDWLGLGRIEGRSLVEQEVSLTTLRAVPAGQSSGSTS